jgi:sterol desaturase/sphingolipid hydroxylase (fatty acid hydroxylase superfamily)
MFQILVPLLFLPLITLEYLKYRKLKRSYKGAEVAASFGVYVGTVLSKFLTGTLLFAIFNWFHQFAVYEITMTSVWSWVGLFFGMEFFYYWMHRASHGIRWIWASHGVHHTASQINFPASFRLAWTGVIAGIPFFFLPLVLIGYSPVAVFGMLAANLTFQFVLHTELIGKLWAPIEYIFNTPSHHRVHHASNAEYLDKNHGGVLIIFDRLFGTYQEEEDHIAIRYGLTVPINSNNPFKIALGGTWDVLKGFGSARTFKDRMMHLFGSPAWQPAEIREASPEPKGLRVS